MSLARLQLQLDRRRRFKRFILFKHWLHMGVKRVLPPYFGSICIGEGVLQYSAMEAPLLGISRQAPTGDGMYIQHWGPSISLFGT